MLKKERRISREDIKALDKPVFFLNSGTVSIRVFVNKNKVSASKFSFSVSKKTEKTAVMRNKLRRSGYDIVRESMDKVHPGYFIRFTFNSTYKEGLEGVLKKEIVDVLNRAKLLKN
jgi:ribonuclease P protein component